jgi:hypothetical protein
MLFESRIAGAGTITVDSFRVLADGADHHGSEGCELFALTRRDKPQFCSKMHDERAFALGSAFTTTPMNSIASYVAQTLLGEPIFTPSSRGQLEVKAGSVLNYAGVGSRVSDIRNSGGVGATCPAGTAARL